MEAQNIPAENKYKELAEVATKVNVNLLQALNMDNPNQDGNK
jgi:hypothetical protein